MKHAQDWKSVQRYVERLRAIRCERDNRGQFAAVGAYTAFAEAHSRLLAARYSREALRRAIAERGCHADGALYRAIEVAS